MTDLDGMLHTLTSGVIMNKHGFVAVLRKKLLDWGLIQSALFRFFFGRVLSIQCCLLACMVGLLSTKAFSAETDWIRIGQVQEFIVDINELSIQYR